MLRSLGFLCLAISLTACTPPPARLAAGTQLETVPSVDPDRYLGLWFEVVRADHSFERGCDGVTAFYERRPDGDIRVINRCWENGLDGTLDIAEGRARIVDPLSNAQLEVSFFGPFFGDYWIIDLADDYSWAVVSEPQGRYLWILTRLASWPWKGTKTVPGPNSTRPSCVLIVVAWVATRTRRSSSSRR